MSPPVLLQRLERRLPVLTGGARDLPARQRTLRTAIAWSHDLLSVADQTLFARLAVFVGGWTLEAAEAVVNGDGALDVFGGLASLVDRSLVRQVEHADGTVRFGMLETIREFAHDQWHANVAEAADVERHHAEFFAGWVIAVERELNVGRRATVVKVDAERDNLRAALAWLVMHQATDLVLAATGSLSEYWSLRGAFTEARRWLARALSLETPATPTARAKALYGMALIALFQGELATSRTVAHQLLQLAETSDDRLGRLMGMFVLIDVELSDRQVEGALAWAEQGYALAHQPEDPVWAAWFAQMLGQALFVRGDIRRAKVVLREPKERFEGLGGDAGLSYALDDLARVVAAGGRVAETARLHAASLQMRQDLRMPAGIVNNLVSLAGPVQRLGDPERAAHLLGAAEGLSATYGYNTGFAQEPISWYRSQGHLDPLRHPPFEPAWRHGLQMTVEQALAEAFAAIAQLDAPAS